MDKQRRSRKWLLALWGATLATVAVGAGIAGAFVGASEVSTLVVQGFGMFATVLALYSAANVTQKNVEVKRNDKEAR